MDHQHGSADPQQFIKLQLLHLPVKRTSSKTVLGENSGISTGTRKQEKESLPSCPSSHTTLNPYPHQEIQKDKFSHICNLPPLASWIPLFCIFFCKVQINTFNSAAGLKLLVPFLISQTKVT